MGSSLKTTKRAAESADTLVRQIISKNAGDIIYAVEF